MDNQWWHAQAECSGADPEVWFPFYEVDGELVGDDGTIGAPIDELYAEAKAICSVCPVRSDCLAYAMNNKERYGCWGGLAPLERLRIERKHRRQRLVARRQAEAENA